MDANKAVELKDQVFEDMSGLVIEGVIKYGPDTRRVISIEEEAAYRLCHHDFYGLSRNQAAQILGVDRRIISQRLASMKSKAPQLFPILSKRVATIYHKFIVDNMTIRAIADDLAVSPRYCWKVLKSLYDNREKTGIYFMMNAASRLYYRPSMDENVKESF